MVHLKAAALAILAPALAFAQQASDPNVTGGGPGRTAQPVTPAGGTDLGNWVLVILAIAVIAIVLFGARAMIQRRRNPPHGPQSPTPRGA